MRRKIETYRGLSVPGILVALILMTVGPAIADHHEKAKEAGEHAMAAGPAEGLGGAGMAYMKSWDRAAEKLISLAEAMPVEKYTWRPAEGVRSTSETFMHVAGGNFFLSRPLGAEIPEGIGRELEKETDKAKVVATLKQSLDHARAAVQGFDVAKLAEEVEVFGQTMTYGDVLMILGGHVQEHLGQSIAYARMNGVVPPWSRPADPAGDGAAEEGGE